MDHSETTIWHGTTILCVRKGGQVVVAGDGQVLMGQTVVKSNARKLRRLAGGSVIAGFAGTTADAITLFERLEAKHLTRIRQVTSGFAKAGEGYFRPDGKAIIFQAAQPGENDYQIYTLELSPDAKVFVDYDGRLGSRLQEHSVSGGLRVRF